MTCEPVVSCVHVCLGIKLDINTPKWTCSAITVSIPQRTQKDIEIWCKEYKNIHTRSEPRIHKSNAMSPRSGEYYSRRRTNLYFSSWGFSVGLKLDFGFIFGRGRWSSMQQMSSSSCKERWTSIFGNARGDQWVHWATGAEEHHHAYGLFQGCLEHCFRGLALQESTNRRPNPSIFWEFCLFARVAYTGNNRKGLPWMKKGHPFEKLAVKSGWGHLHDVPVSDAVGQYTLAEPLWRKGDDSIRGRGKSARTGWASLQRSKYSYRLQHSTVNPFPKQKMIFLYLLIFSGFLFLSINL